MWPFIFVAGFAIGVVATLLFGVAVDRIPFPDTPEPSRSGETAATPPAGESHETG